jgi:hypothetical protein
MWGFHLTEKKTGKNKKGNGKGHKDGNVFLRKKQTVPFGEKRKRDFCRADGETEPL